ncbi:MAG: monovalent cation/H+ antiporter complex subunit F [Actinomycetota bacterium]
MIAVDVALAALATTFLLALIRVVIGPSIADRAMATDVCLFSVVTSIALIAVRTGTESFLDVVLVASLLGFLATISLARLVKKDRG